VTPIHMSYVVPIRCDAHCGGHRGLQESLDDLRRSGIEVLVVDGSSGSAELSHQEAFAGVRRLVIDNSPGLNGKVSGVCAGVPAATHELVVIADDDVRFDRHLLDQLAERLGDADLVVPQNYFIGPRRWHTEWDTARTLLNRAMGHDYPGTLALRRSMFLGMGGYDGTALFENLELIRTVRAAGGRVRWAPDIFVPRVGPATSAFLRQRVRQAYDDLGQPLRLVLELSLLPSAAWAISRRRARVVGMGAVGAIALAELGRRRDGGRVVFPWRASLAAPLWLFERACCVWVAVWLRVARGGVLYRGARLRKAASSPWKLRRRVGDLHGVTSASMSAVEERCMSEPKTAEATSANPDRHLGGAAPAARLSARAGRRA
jgi:hypothetical protein